MKLMSRNIYRIFTLTNGVPLRELRLFYSADAHKRGPDSTVVSDGSKPWLKEAEHFMANLDEETTKRKNELDILIEVMRHEGTPVPSFISPLSWKLLLTECKNQELQVEMLNRLYRNENKKKVSLQIQQKNIARRRELRESENLFSQTFDSIKRKRKLWKGLVSLKSDMPVVIDLDYEERRVAQNFIHTEIMEIWGSNLNHIQPLDVYFTSVHKNYNTNQININDQAQYFHGRFYEEHYTELFPRKDLVYLTPHGPPLFEFDTDCVYVLGANTGPLRGSYKKAKRDGTRVCAFPIMANLKLNKGAQVVLKTSTAFQILQDMYLLHSWIDAFSKKLPKNKFVPRETSISRVINTLKYK